MRTAELEIVRGTPGVWRCVVSNVSTIVGSTIVFSVKRAYTDAAPLFTVSTAGDAPGIEILNATTFRVTVPHDATLSLTNEEAVLYFDVLLTTSDGQGPFCVTRGTLAVFPVVGTVTA